MSDIEIENLLKEICLGYVPVMGKYSNWQKAGHICEYEYYIENMPVHEESTELSCHIFGHDCPGGLEHRKACNKNYDVVMDELEKEGRL